MTRKTYLSILICLIVSQNCVCSGKYTQLEWGNPNITVKQDAGQWTIQGKRLKVVINSNSLAMQVKDKDITWNIEGSIKGDLTIEHDGWNILLRLRDAQQVEIEFYERVFMPGIKIRFRCSYMAKRVGRFSPSY